jgi:hypothetical protein
MATPKALQDQAARLLAIALQARERGDVELAEQLTARAMQYLDQGSRDEADPAGPAMPPPPAEPAQPVAQQQQQIQPDAEKPGSNGPGEDEAKS